MKENAAPCSKMRRALNVLSDAGLPDELASIGTGALTEKLHGGGEFPKRAAVMEVWIMDYCCRRNSL